MSARRVNAEAEQLALLAEGDKLRARVAELVAQRDDLLVEAATAPDMDALVRERDQYRDETIVLRARVDEVERAYTFDTAALKKRVAELELELRIGTPWTCGPCGKQNTRDVCVICETDRPELAEDEETAPHSAPCRVPASPDCTCPPAATEDPHDSPLHHEYPLGRDLGGAL